MVISDIQNFSEGRTKARAYFCYLFSKNIPNKLPSLSVEMVVQKLLRIKSELEHCEGVYLLDYRGVQISPTFTQNRELNDDIGKIRSDRAYYYRAVREGRCIVTDPYPSLITGDLTVTASQPIYDEKGELLYVACLDMPLHEVVTISRQNHLDNIFNKLFKYSYAAFALALMGIAMLLFFKGLQSFAINKITPVNFELKEVFESTILITLALAIFDLAKTLIEEELLGRTREKHSSDPHRTMIKFLGSIIIALSIEALMLVFKFSMTNPEELIHAVYIVGSISSLLATLAIYIRFTRREQE